jgi:hypothetical protein
LHVVVAMANDEIKPPVRRRSTAGGRRRHRVAVTFTGAELADIRAAAERSHLAVAAFLGKTGLAAARAHEMPASDALRELLRAVITVQTEASRQGSNLNQAVTQLNSAGVVTPAIERRLQAALADVGGTMREINAAIRHVRGRL